MSYFFANFRWDRFRSGSFWSGRLFIDFEVIYCRNDKVCEVTHFRRNFFQKLEFDVIYNESDRFRIENSALWPIFEVIAFEATIFAKSLMLWSDHFGTGLLSTGIDSLGIDCKSLNESLILFGIKLDSCYKMVTALTSRG